MSREADLYKDKIEVSLDGRQIFYLFFGGAVIVGLVFVLGVMVGRRVEARGHVERAQTTATVDPLAALDRLEGNPSSLSFKGALMNKGADASSDVDRTIAELEKTRGKSPAKADAKAGTNGDTKSDVKPDAKAGMKTDAGAKSDANGGTKTDAKSAVKSDAKGDGKTDAKAMSKDDTAAKADKAESKPDAKSDKPKAAAAPADDGDDDDKPVTKPEEVEKKKPKYTLQLSSFQDRSEADSFLAQMKASGYQAYVTEAAVAGKGTFYRVRMGSYRSLDAANEAKAEFEKAAKKSASVMKL